MHVEGLPIGTVGGILAKVTLPLDGEYQIAVKMFRTNLGVMRGLEYEHEIEYTVDGARVHTFRMGGEADFKANLVNMTKAGDVIDERGRLQAEAHRRAARASPRRSSGAATRRTRRGCSRSSAVRPTRATRPATRTSTPSRSPAPSTRPAPATRRAAARSSPAARRRRRGTDGEDACARKIIGRLARLAYRGDVTRRRSAAAVRVLRRRAQGRGPARARRLRARHPESAAAHPGEPEVLLPHRAGSARRRARRASTASAISSWRRGCRSSSGAAFPTRSCSISRRRTGCTRPAVLEPQVRRMLRGPEGRGAHDELRRPVAVSAQPEEHAAELGGVPGLRRQPAAGVRTRSRRCFSQASSTKTATSSI